MTWPALGPGVRTPPHDRALLCLRRREGEEAEGQTYLRPRKTVPFATRSAGLPGQEPGPSRGISSWYPKERRKNVPTEPLRIVAPHRRLHAEAIIDLVAKAFSGEEGGYYTVRDACRRMYVLHSHYDWECSRIGLLGDRLATHYGVWKYLMRIGGARVQVGGIGAVATDPEFRRRGYMGRTLPASLESMRAEGYDLSLLFGISNFYRHYGYVQAWGTVSSYAAWRTCRRRLRPRPVQKFAVRPRADLAELYNAYYSDMTGTAVRPTFLRGSWSWQGHTEGYLWKQDGKPAGYVVFARNGQHLRCIEYAGDSVQALRVVAALGRKVGCQEIHFATVPDQSVLIKLLRRNNCRVETRYARDGGAMVRVLNLAATLRKMEGELTRRLAASPLATWRGELILANAEEQVALKIGRGAVATSVQVSPEAKHAILGGPEIAQLLIGTESPSEVMEAACMKVTGEARPLAEVLFPAQHPQLSQLDRF